MNVPRRTPPGAQRGRPESGRVRPRATACGQRCSTPPSQLRTRGRHEACLDAAACPPRTGTPFPSTRPREAPTTVPAARSRHRSTSPAPLSRQRRRGLHSCTNAPAHPGPDHPERRVPPPRQPSARPFRPDPCAAPVRSQSPRPVAHPSPAAPRLLSPLENPRLESLICSSTCRRRCTCPRGGCAGCGGIRDRRTDTGSRPRVTRTGWCGMW